MAFSIAKEEKSTFYIRLLNDKHDNYLKLYDGGDLIDSILIVINKTTPLPAYSFYRGYHGDFQNAYVFDSITISPYFYDSIEDVYTYYAYKKQSIFKVLFFTVDIVRNHKIIYSECIRGSKYSPKALKMLHANVRLARPSAPTGTVRVRSVTVTDDLGNIYILPESLQT